MVNYFAEKVEKQKDEEKKQKDEEKKLAQTLVIGASLLARPVFNSIEKCLKATNNEIA